MQTHRREIYKTALISSPVMAAFAASPIFFTASGDVLNLGRLYILLTSMALLVWITNILLLEWIEKRWLRNVISYAVSVIHLPLIKLYGYFFPIINSSVSDHTAPVFYIYPLINIMALNAIVILMTKAILIRSRQSQTQAELDALKIKHLEAEQQQLINQLQPHFLFNSLSTLKSLISQDADKAEDYTVTLSDFLRYTVSAHEKILISLQEELHFTNDYAHLLKTRFPDSFFFEVDLNGVETDKKYLPVYALQTLIENAIKHNAFSHENPLKVRVQYENNQLIISNNIVPKFKNAKVVGIGLQNLRKRYRIITQQDSVIIRKSDSLFTVIINLLDQNVASSNY